MNVLIIGGGKVGYYLACALIEHEHTPTIIELSKTSCEELANALDIPILHGDGTKIEHLKTAKIEQMDSFISVTGKDEDNLISCQLAKNVFHVPKTIARVNNPKNSAIMKQLGIDLLINSTDRIVNLLEQEVDISAIKELASLNMGESTIAEIQIPDAYRLNGISLADLRLPHDYIVISVIRNSRTIIPRGDTKILNGDKILVLSLTDALHDLAEYLKLEL